METCEATKKKEQIILEEPKKWKVIFWNDNVTPMGLVVEILMNIFNYDKEKSVLLMLEVHHKGSSVVGTYYKSIAETKKNLSLEMSKKLGYPLKVTIEQE